MKDDDLLGRLFALNKARASSEQASPPAKRSKGSVKAKVTAQSELI